MAYGFSTAVEVVTRLLKPVKAYLHELGIKLSIFVDDGRISASTESETWEKFQFALEVIQLCGWNIQWKKTSTEATQSLLHLGFVTDSKQMRYFLPIEKEEVVLKQLQGIIQQGLSGEAIPALGMASLLGRINSMRRSHGAVLGVMSRTCNHLMGEAVLEEGWQSRVLLTYEAVRELQYLADNIRRLNGQHIQSREAKSKVVSLQEAEQLVSKIRESDADIENLFVSDASDVTAFVYGADGTFLAVREFEFSEQERTASSGMRELLAVQKMLSEGSEHFKKFKGGSVYWQTDSKNSYIFLSRGSRKPLIQDIVADIKCQERKLDIQIIPVWTPRSHARIVLADMGSKMHTSTDEWCVDRDKLAEIFVQLQFVPEVDCCAARSNAVCEKFFSKIPQVGTSGVNFLSQKLESGVNYFCCPPVKMIGRVVCHLLESENISSVLIVPRWTSCVFWPAITENRSFQKAVKKTVIFRTKFFMSNNVQSLFSRCRSMEMAAFLIHT